MKLINQRKFERLQKEAFKNCLRLIEDAVFLFHRGSYPSSVQLSILALEELGKSYLISDLIVHHYCDEIDERILTLYMKAIHGNHVLKQWKLYRERLDLTSQKSIEAFQKAKSGIYEKLKQRSVYVGLTNKDVKQRISCPIMIGRKTSRKLLVEMLELLISIVREEQRNITYTDGIHELLNNRLLRRLEDFRRSV